MSKSDDNGRQPTRDSWARRGVYVVVILYLWVLVVYSIFLIVAIGLTADDIWHIPWHTLTAMVAGELVLGLGCFLFRSPIRQLFPDAPSAK